MLLQIACCPSQATIVLMESHSDDLSAKKAWLDSCQFVVDCYNNSRTKQPDSGIILLCTRASTTYHSHVGLYMCDYAGMTRAISMGYVPNIARIIQQTNIKIKIIMEIYGNMESLSVFYHFWKNLHPLPETPVPWSFRRVALTEVNHCPLGTAKFRWHLLHHSLRFS